MSNYDDRLKTLREEALETQETLQDLPADAWPSKATRSRTLGVFGYVRTILETTDPELLSDQAFQQVSSALAQFKSNPAAGASTADPWTSTLIDAIAQLPAARDREVEQSVKDAAANFQRSAQQRLNALKDEYAGTKTDLQELKAEIEERRAELGAAIDQSKTEISTRLPPSRLFSSRSSRNMSSSSRASRLRSRSSERPRRANSNLLRSGVLHLPRNGSKRPTKSYSASRQRRAMRSQRAWPRSGVWRTKVLSSSARSALREPPSATGRR